MKTTRIGFAHDQNNACETAKTLIVTLLFHFLYAKLSDFPQFIDYSRPGINQASKR